MEAGPSGGAWSRLMLALCKASLSAHCRPLLRLDRFAFGVDRHMGRGELQLRYGARLQGLVGAFA